MTEYHDHPGDEHHDVPPPDVDLPDAPDPDAFAEQHMPSLGDLGSAQPAPAELHFPGDDSAEPAGSADLEPSAPWPDDGGFAQWLQAGDPATDVPPAGDGLAAQFDAAPQDAPELPSSDELVDWTLRQLGDA